MASSVTNYQCPSCQAPLRFSGESGKLQCDYCGNSYSVSEIEALYSEKDAKAEAYVPSPKAWIDEGGSMRAYNCPSCGAELLCDASTAATSCPYCGNPTVVPGQFSGVLKPDYVIPFKLDRKKAIEALKNHYKGKILLPKAFKDENHIEDIKGIYAPFWLFDGQAEVHMAFKATKSKSRREGDYRITTTYHYDVRRRGAMDFEKVPVDASSKMPDDLMDSLEPFDYSELKEFSKAYLPGYMADKYDVDSKTAQGRSDERCCNTAFSEIESTVRGYESLEVSSKSAVISKRRVSYALLPLWLLSTKWNGKNYIFAMNGQSGKLVGDLPWDKTKLRLWFWGTAAVVSCLIAAFFSRSLGNFIAGLFA